MSDETKKLLEEQFKAWEAFKETNDSRLEALESKGYAPSDVVEKVERINEELNEKGKQIGELVAKMNRPTPPDGKGETLEVAEYKDAFAHYLRKGDEKGLRELEQKALSSFSDPDGGYLILPEMDNMIDRIAATVSGLRTISNVRTIGTRSYQKLVKTRGVSGGWLSEAGTSSESTEPQWSKIDIEAHKLYAEPWVPNEMLEDSFYDLEGDLMMESAVTFGETEGSAFITGTGVEQPRGILGYTEVADASYTWGNVGYIASGAAGAFATSAPSDKLIDLQHALHQQYRPGASFVMNDATLSTVRQMKDASGAYYLWQPDTTMGFGGRLLGSPVVIDDNMPVVAANSYSIAYGNFQRGYTIVDRRGVAVIRDPYTKKGVTKFHVSKRVGGGITNFEAIKLLKMASS